MWITLRNRFWIVLLIILGAVNAWGQSDRELAEEYLRKGECDKAVVLFQKGLKKTFDKNALRKYVACQIKLKDWEETEKFFKKQLRSKESWTAFYELYYGRILEAAGKPELATERYEAAIKNEWGASPDFYKELSDEFREVQDNNNAVNALLKGREVAKNDALFKMELAQLYQITDRSDLMIEEMLSLGVAIQNKEVVQNYLGDFLRDEKEQAKFEKILYKKIQLNPNEVFYPEMLIWLYVQKKDFGRAFVQEKALDRRLRFGGERVFQLGKLTLENRDFKNAVNMFDYVVKEYPRTQLYEIARRYAIFSREEQVKETYPINQPAVRRLIDDYKKYLAELGTNARTMEAVRSVANLCAFYNNDKDTAIIVLTDAIRIARNDPNFIDRCKLDLGNVYLLKNEPWEATLLYSQVEKSQKDDALGYEAKLRNAKLYYYKGDFALSKEILDILKQATTREIANDANDLSLLIMDNTGLDSSEAAMRAYSAVELLMYQNRIEEGLADIEQLITKYKDHPIADELYFMKANTLLKLDDVDKAVENYQKIVDNYQYDILADDALFAIAKIMQERKKEKEKAMDLYQLLLEKYPGSIFGTEARKRYRQLRGDTI